MCLPSNTPFVLMQEGDAEKLPGWPDTYGSIGGRFNNFMLCKNQHRTMFDFTFLEELLKEAGFTRDLS